MNLVNNTVNKGNKGSLFETISLKKGGRNDKRTRVLVLTNCKYKKKEFDKFLSDGYGVNLSYRTPPEVVTDEVVRQILSEEKPTPHHILLEKSELKNAITQEVVSGKEIIENPKKAPRFVSHEATLRVWTPEWNKDDMLSKVQFKEYIHEIKGYIDGSRKDQKNDDVFGWDHLFVNARTGQTNLEAIHSIWEKTSSRQLVLSDFVTSHLFYKTPQALKFHKDLQPKQGIEFSPKMSVGRFMENNQYLSNPHLSLWGLKPIRDRILDGGVFFKAGTSRPVKNYFSPPFGGVPLTSKKSDVEETVFMMHDLNHHNIPDLIFDGNDSEEMRNVYVAWRMASEAMTLVIADMLYADTLVRTSSKNIKNVDSRIYPLFKALDIEEPTEVNRQEIIRRLLWANTQFAVLGDDSEWKKMLKPGCEEKLFAYKNHFEKFFIGDHDWTHTNFKNMVSIKEHYTQWIDTVGRDQFDKAGLRFLSEVVEKIQARGADLSSLSDVVKHVFEEIIETRIFPKSAEDTSIVDEESRLSRAFHRYMIGQMSFYSRYEELPKIIERANSLASMIKTTPFFDDVSRQEIYNRYAKDVSYVWGMGVITSAAADNYMQVHPIFPPSYISYGRQESNSIKEIVNKLYENKE